MSDGEKFPVYVLDMPQECIKSVTIGERTPVQASQEIWSIVKNTNISLSLAAISNRGYEFRTDIIKFGVPISKMGPVINPRTAHIFSGGNSALGDVARHLVEHHPMSEIVNDTV